MKTVWCEECEGPSDVESVGVEEDRFGEEWWVTVLDCGHEEVSPR